jgi:2-(1,2-epoxy-1,2-dihydrophenyl)acetyl-CoA isomerase
MSPTVLYRTDGPVATVTLNRPARRNAVSTTLFGDLAQALDRAGNDSAVRVVQLTGAGRHFCVGSDLTGPLDQRVVRGEDAAADEERLLAASRVVTLLTQMSKPSIAVVRGGCAGAGLALALACDLRYAADTAVFNTGYLSAALTGDLGVSWLLTRVAGPAKARELMLLPGRMPAARAAAAGLVTAVVPADELEACGADAAERLAAFAPQAVAWVRRNLDDALTLSLPAYLPVEARRLLAQCRSDDVSAARTAFADKDGRRRS